MSDGTETTGTRPGNTFLIVMLGILLALTIKSAVDHTFEGLGAYANLGEAWNAFSKAPGTTSLIAFQLVVFFFTLARYYLGAYRYAEESEGQPTLESVINFIGAFLLFLGFYIASLVIRTTQLFYWLTIFFLLVDLAWFFLVGTVLEIPERVGRIVHIWQLFDVVTIIPVALFMLFLPEYIAQVLSLLVISGVGIWDLVWLRWFYRNDADWPTRTKWIKRLTKHQG